MEIDTVCKSYRVDVKEIMSRVFESHQNLENNMRDFANEVENQFTRNNDRNNQQEVMLKALGGGLLA